MPDETPHALGTLHDEVFAFLEATEPTEPTDEDLDEELAGWGDHEDGPDDEDVRASQAEDIRVRGALIRRAYGSSKE